MAALRMEISPGATASCTPPPLKLSMAAARIITGCGISVDIS
jgi:hypothetical protein